MCRIEEVVNSGRTGRTGRTGQDTVGCKQLTLTWKSHTHCVKELFTFAKVSNVCLYHWKITQNYLETRWKVVSNIFKIKHFDSIRIPNQILYYR